MAQLLLANPRKRRTKRRTPARSTRRRYRRNPIQTKGLMDTVQKGAIGAAGALAVDIAMARLPIPANFAAGPLAPATRGLIGVGLGMLVSKFTRKKRLGEQLADGAVTVALYGVGKSMVGAQMGLSGDLLGDAYYDEDFGYISPAGFNTGMEMEDAYVDNSDF